MAEQSLRLETFWTLIRYGSVGVINTAVSVGTMVVLAYAGLHYAIYTAAGYFLAFCTSYVLNAFFTFRVGGLSRRQFFTFVLINGSLLLLTEALQFGLIELVLVSEVVGVGCGLVFYTVLGFFLNRRYVYRAI